MSRALSSPSVGLASLWSFASLFIIRGPTPAKCIFESLRCSVPPPIHQREHLLHPVVAGDAHILLHQGEQPPEREEHRGLHAHGRPLVARINVAHTRSRSPLQ